jgi:hypothetical protein
MNMNRNIQPAAAGNMNAFEELYWSQRRRVYRLCLRMTAVHQLLKT